MALFTTEYTEDLELALEAQNSTEEGVFRGEKICRGRDYRMGS